MHKNWMSRTRALGASVLAARSLPSCCTRHFIARTPRHRPSPRASQQTAAPLKPRQPVSAASQEFR